ncbi:unnamed protein product [Sympodiomycopsis kandeliae]
MALEEVFDLSERSPSPVPDPPLSSSFQSSAEYRDRTPIVIDNGGSELRAGFATQAFSSSESSSGSSYSRISKPPPIRFPPVVSKYRDRKKTANILLVGPYANMDTESKSKARGPNENGLLVSQDVLENMLDFTFSRLGLSEDGGTVQHPVVMTEPLCNPGYCRGLTSELLFEAYGVPEVSYGNDSLFAAYANDVTGDAVIVNGGQTHTTIIPMVGGRGILGNAKRLNWGGNSASEHLLRQLQLKYPGFPVRLTSSQTNSLMERPGLFYAHPGGVEGDYTSHLQSLSDLDRLQAENRKVQVPFVVPESTKKQLTDEERQRREERKKESARRLQEMTQRNRLQKLMEKEEQLRKFSELKSWKAKERKAEYLQRLEAAGFDSEQDLDKQEKRIQSALKRSRKRDDVADDEVEETQTAPSFLLVEVPDHELDEESIKEKRRQRLLKAGYDARMRAKAEKAEERRLEEEKRLQDEQERTMNLAGWTQSRREEYEEIIERIKERKRRRELLSDRKSLAAQQRMKNITSLASDSPSGSRNKRKRGGGGDKDNDDDFGANDADWSVYRDIQGAEDSDDEEEDEQQLITLENKLLQYDSKFTKSDTLAARQARQRALTRTFLGGTPSGEEEFLREQERKRKEEAGGDDADEDDEEEAKKNAELARNHQITLNIERSRLTEIYFQPSLAGVDQAGLDEVVDMIVKRFPDETQKKMVNNIFVTGRHTSYTGFDTRFRNSIIATQPYGYDVKIKRANDVRFDAWKGMAKWCIERPDERHSSSFTKQQYAEMGSDYLKDHPFASSMV